MNEYWLRQNDEPLFQDILWSRPENKKAAGSLLILGGHTHNLMAPIKAYEVAKKIGVGDATVVMPDAVPDAISAGDEVVTVESSKSGGISKKAAESIHKMIGEVDATLWPGSVGSDSETTQLLDNLIRSESIPTTLTGDSLESTLKSEDLLKRKNTHLVVTVSQLRSVATNLELTKAITSDMQLTSLIDSLHTVTNDYPATVSTFYENNLVSSQSGQVSTTKIDTTKDKEDFKWRIEFATISAVLQAQFPNRSFEAVTTAAWLFKEGHDEN